MYNSGIKPLVFSIRVLKLPRRGKLILGTEVRSTNLSFIIVLLCLIFERQAFGQLVLDPTLDISLANDALLMPRNAPGPGDGDGVIDYYTDGDLIIAGATAPRL